MLVAIEPDFRQRHVVGHVELAGAKHPLLVVGQLDGKELDLVDLDVCPIPISRLAHDDDLLVRAPFLEHVRSVAHEIFRARPRRAFPVEAAEFLDHGNRDRIPRVMIQGVE